MKAKVDICGLSKPIVWTFMKRGRKPFELQKKMLPDLIKKGLSGRQAAKRLRVSKSLVYEWIAELGLPKRKYTKLREIN
jgi:predicted DNA-binding transcriptional regulator AlpA